MALPCALFFAIGDAIEYVHFNRVIQPAIRSGQRWQRGITRRTIGTARHRFCGTIRAAKRISCRVLEHHECYQEYCSRHSSLRHRELLVNSGLFTYSVGRYTMNRDPATISVCTPAARNLEPETSLKWTGALFAGFLGVLFCLALTVQDAAYADEDLPGPGKAWFDRGSFLLREGNYDSARHCFDSVAALAGTGKYEEYLRAMTGSATSLVFTGRLDTAEVMVRHALAQMPADTCRNFLAVADAYALLAYVQSFFDRPDSALALNAKSYEIRRLHLGTSHPSLSNNYYTSGLAHGKQGLYHEAVKDFQEALRLSPPAPGSAVRLASFHVALGNALRECHEYDRALRHFDTTMTMLHTAGLGESYDMVSGLVHAAFCEAERGELYRALSLYDSAAERTKRVSPHNATVLTSIRASMGRAYLALGDLDRALEMCADALERSRLLRSHLGTIFAGSRLHGALPLVGKCASVAAREHAEQALKLRIDAYGSGHPDVAAAYEGLADIETQMGMYRDALAHLRVALQIRTDVAGATDPSLLAGPMIAIAHVQHKIGDTRDAELSIARVLGMCHAGLVPDPLIEARAYEEAGDINVLGRDLSGALAHYDSSMSVLLRAVNVSRQDMYVRLADLAGGQRFLDLLKKKGSVLRTLAPPADGAAAFKRAALETYAISCRTLLSLRSRYESEGSKFRLVGDLSQVCDHGVSLALELFEQTKDRHYLLTAFSFAELNKAGMLLNGIRQSKVRSFAGVPDGLVAAERTLKSRLTALELELAALQDASTSGAAKRRNLQWDIMSLREERRSVSERLRKMSPAYARLVNCDSLPVLADIQSAIDDSTLLLEYFSGAKNVVVFLISKHGVEYRDLGSREKIESAVAALTGSIRMVDHEGFVAASRRAYTLLISPARRTVARYARLVVIPDGSLCTVPFETLIPGTSLPAGIAPKFSALPFLIRSHEIMVSPSARLLAESSHDVVPSGIHTWKFAGFAPIFNDPSIEGPVLASARSGGGPDADALRSVSVNGRVFRALPHSDREVTNIAAEFGAQGLRSRTFVNEQASEENFKQSASSCTHLHIATHGFVNAQDPARSALLFAPPAGSGTEEDGVLYAAEAYNLHLNAELVVLSSCESGVGRFVKGEGVYALMRGFLYSGARNIMYSLWQVMDRHTSELMQAFYEEALKGMPSGKALQHAKLRMIANERTAFPFSWAGFVLVGR